MLKNEPPFSL